MSTDDKGNVSLIETLKIKTPYNPEDSKDLVLLGVLEFVKLPEKEQAVQHLTKAIQLDPFNIDARFWLAICLCHYFDKCDQAEEILLKALELDPNRADCLSLAAYLHWDRKSFETGLLYLRKATQICPDWPLLRIELVYLLMNLGQIEEAEYELEKAYSLLKQPIKTPENEIEQYYENNITGRSWTNLAERLDKLKNLRYRLVEEPSFLEDRFQMEIS